MKKNKLYLYGFYILVPFFFITLLTQCNKHKLCQCTQITKNVIVDTVKFRETHDSLAIGYFSEDSAPFGAEVETGKCSDLNKHDIYDEIATKGTITHMILKCNNY